MNWIDRFIGSNAFRTIIKGAYWGCIAIALLFLFMIGSFLFKIYVLDYRFDDGELHPPIEASINISRFVSAAEASLMEIILPNRNKTIVKVIIFVNIVFI
ncbi:hypothetical protein MTP04_16860 [Lysinibacillus sp. PLM2]|nr:hypothetical protein MTP04_16860 [Lysinibacillus sp. PLM2]